MMTNTHMLIGAAVTTRPQFRWWQIALGWIGGFIPDINIVIMIAWARITGVGRENMWRAPDGLYWQQPWQTYSAIGNSIPMWAAGLALGYWIFRASERFKEAGRGVMIFCGACLAHVLCDLPVHTDDAHVHFWPFTDWRFHSWVSYYRRSEYGEIVGALEMVIGLALAIYLFRRFKQWPVRALSVLMVLPYFMSIGFIFFRP